MTSWDSYWLEVCETVASNSKCLSRKIGAVIVKDHKFQISAGYNGPPAGCRHCGHPFHRSKLFALHDKTLCGPDSDLICPRKVMGFGSGEGLQYCQSAHAERNAIDIAARLGHSVEGCSLYLNTIMPCFECAKTIINSGIKEIVVLRPEDYEKSGLTGVYLLTQAEVKIRAYDC